MAVHPMAPAPPGAEVFDSNGPVPDRRRRIVHRSGRVHADTVEKVIAEVAATRITERGATRADDRVSEAAMEDRKELGYF